MSRPHRAFRAPLHALALLILAAACASDELEAPPEQTEGTLTVDASTDWAYASVLDESLVSVADPSTSSEWDIGFNATRVMLNGGAAGPGGVLGHCNLRRVADTVRAPAS